jgi:hypothetical protein
VHFPDPQRVLVTGAYFGIGWCGTELSRLHRAGEKGAPNGIAEQPWSIRSCGGPNMTHHLASGDDVAIMPTANSPAADVLEIATVTYICRVFIQLAEGRMYGSIGGKGLFSNAAGYAVRVTEEHRAALKAKRGRSLTRA